MTNARIAVILDRVASLLEQQGASAHRVRAWCDAARTVRESRREMSELLRSQGRAGLEALPGIGPRLASVVNELVETGQCSTLVRLRGDGGHILERIPGIGPQLAARAHDTLGIDTLEDLEAAVHDGRLARVPGFGTRRIAGLRDVLATRLARTRVPRPSHAQPPIALLLDLDREYRRAAAAGELRKIAPRRFNPTHEAWLPIMHLDRDGWAFTVVFSNTARAHELGRTRDWVIVYFHRPDQPEGQATIVTEWRGRHRGERVVRGREHESVGLAA